jgi:signal transduction histidine kinase
MEEANSEIKNYSGLSDFVEAASHDLNAPLRKLSVLIDRVFTKYKGQFDEPAKEYITRIDSCIKEMRSIIDGLTEIARTDVKGMVFTECDLFLMAKQTLELMSDEIQEKQAEVHIDSLPVVYGNTIQYKQLFRNLLENAIKFGKKNEPVEIDISAELVKNDEKILSHFPNKKKYYKIQIIDNGIGFNQANAERIFEPFVRLHSKSEYAGNGLGLSICKKVVANHNGIIYAEGKENGGSRFTLILPETP